MGRRKLPEAPPCQNPIFAGNLVNHRAPRAEFFQVISRKARSPRRERTKRLRRKRSRLPVSRDSTKEPCPVRRTSAFHPEKFAANWKAEREPKIHLPVFQ